MSSGGGHGISMEMVFDSGGGYTSKATAINGIESVKAKAPVAPIDDHTG